MRSKGNRPTAAHKKWYDLIANEGSVISRSRPVFLHHPEGAMAKIKSVGNIGHWYVIPLAYDEHYALHRGDLYPLFTSFEHWTGRDCGDMSRREFEKHLFARMCKKFVLPFSDEIYQAIMEYTK